MHTHFRARRVLGPVCGGGPSMRLWRLASRAAAGVMPAAQTPVSGRFPPNPVSTVSRRWVAARTPRARSSEHLFNPETCALQLQRTFTSPGSHPANFRVLSGPRSQTESPPMFLISFIHSLPFIILLYFLRDLPTLLLTVNSTVTESISGGSCWPAAVPFLKSLF